MIGVSLPIKWLISGEGFDVDREDLLQKLKARGVRSIELRTVAPTHSPDDVSAVANILWDRGFLISVHGRVKSAKTAVSDVFSPLQKILTTLRQAKLNITVHPIKGDNVAMLCALADHIENNDLPVTIALENNRLLPDKTEGDSAALVLDAVKKADRACLGICFDFGHYLYYRLKNFPQEPVIFPPKEFFKRVIHTHIHALNGLRTHFPLNRYQMPLGDIFNKLSHEYFGLYNIELDFPRFCEIHGIEESLLGSVDVLRDNLPICAKLYDDIRDNFDGWFSSALTALEGEQGVKFGLIHSTSYLFNTNGYRWGMDLAFRNARKLAETPKKCAELLGNLDLMIISHGHNDHFEKSTVKALAKTDVEWVIPDFLYESALECGIVPNRIHVAKENEELQIGKLTVLPFKGRHFRPDTGKGIEEYGYYVTAKDAPSLVFPVDVRDFSLERLQGIPKADYCFAHVWLGDKSGLKDDYSPIDRKFAEFMLKLSDKNIFLAHLYENGRKDEDMWRECHAEIIKSRIAELSPATRVTVPKCGEVIELRNI